MNSKIVTEAQRVKMCQFLDTLNKKFANANSTAAKHLYHSKYVQCLRFLERLNADVRILGEKHMIKLNSVPMFVPMPDFKEADILPVIEMLEYSGFKFNYEEGIA